MALARIVVMKVKPTACSTTLRALSFEAIPARCRAQGSEADQE